MIFFKRFPHFGPKFDTADDIFDDSAAAYAALGSGGGTPETPENTEPEKQDVDPKGQGDEKEGTPGTPDESADDSIEKQGDGDGDGDGKKGKVEGIDKVREWGKGWEKTATEREAKLKEFEPTIKFVNEKFGGQEHLNLAAEIYGAIANEDEFNAEGAIEFLSENLPGVADKLVSYIAKNVAETATATAFERTFGRKLNETDINDVKSFLASGKKTDGKKFDSFLKSADTIPDELKFDSEGNERDPQILDYLWKQEQALREASTKIDKLEGRVTGVDEERKQQAASEAITNYISDNFQGIGAKVSELGLDKPVEGETSEVTELRTKHASMLEGLVMWKAGNDPEFQAMYRKAVEATAKLAANPKDRAAKATSIDFSRRIKARIDDFAADAAEYISPLIESFSTKRQEQVTKIKEAKGQPTVPGGHETKPKEIDPDKDPFDSEDIMNEVRDKLRLSRGR
jgi:hypothetical protein